MKKTEKELETCYKWDKTFLESEQSLLIGHQLHPTPKSRQGILPEEEEVFGPEVNGKFQLHYFKAHKSLVAEQSAGSQTASQLIKEQLKKDNKVSEESRTARIAKRTIIHLYLCIRCKLVIF